MRRCKFRFLATDCISLFPVVLIFVLSVPVSLVAFACPVGVTSPKHLLINRQSFVMNIVGRLTSLKSDFYFDRYLTWFAGVGLEAGNLGFGLLFP